jgi:outer membrane protein assembly factor BamA
VAVLVLARAALVGTPSLAQQPALPAPPAPPAQSARPDLWYFRPLVYPTYDGDEGLMGHFSVAWRKGGNRLPPANRKSFAVDTKLATSGTRGASLTFDAPGNWPDWRLLLQVGSERLQRAPFYGVGNSSTVSDSATTHYYRYSLLRTTLLAAGQRRIKGPLRLHAAAQWRHYHARPLDDSTAFAKFLAPSTATDTMPQSIVETRLGLLFDTRDFEVAPSKGVFLEVMANRAISGASYTRWLLSAREFIPLGEFQQTVLGFRQTTELARGTLPIPVAYERLTTWYPEDGFGGATSLRLFAPGRFVAPNRAVFSADWRYKMLDAPFPTSPLRLWLLGFADAGRLWNEGESPTLSDLHWDVGVGARIQIGKGTLFGLDLGRTSEHFGFAVSTSFAF